MARARPGPNASYRQAGVCVFRLSTTSTTFSAWAWTSSTSQRSNSAKSSAVRRSVTSTWPPARQRLEHHEQVGRAVADVLVVVAGRLPRCGRQRGAGLPDQLLGHLVDGHQGPPRVKGPLVDVEDVLHAGHELRRLPRRDDPLLLP